MNYKEQLLKSIEKKIVFPSLPLVTNTKNKIHIGYGIDNGYVRCMITSMVSICQNNKNHSLVFHIMGTGLSEEHINKIKKIADEFLVEINLYKINPATFALLPTQKHLPIPTYFRFILPLILDVPRILYIDADIICLGDISSLFFADLDNKVIAAVQDIKTLSEKRNLALGLGNHSYFNAGVLLIDIEKWNNNIITEKAMEILIKDPEKFRYLDQDALNLLLTGKVYYLDKKWNHLNINVEGQKDSVFLHFAAHPKPWNVAWPLSPLANEFTKDIYHYYEQFTSWKDSVLEMPRNYKEIKIYAKCLFYQGKYLQGTRWYIKYIIGKIIA